MSKSLLMLAVVACSVLVLALQAQGAALKVGTVRGESHTVFMAHHVSQFFQGNSGFKYVRRALPLEKLVALFAVKQRSTDLMQHMVHQVSDPTSPSYGDYLNLEQLGALFGNPQATHTVLTWLHDHGITEVDTTQNGEFVYAKMSVAEAEQLFGADMAEFHLFQTAHSSRSALRSPAYTLPNQVADAVDFVANIINLPMPIAPKFQAVKAVKQTPHTAGDVDPSVLFKYYNIQQSSSVNPSSSQSVFEALGQDYSPNDLTAFQKKYGVSVNPIAQVIGPNTPFMCVLNPNSCGEATLDVEYMMAVAQNIPTVYWSIPSSSQDPFLDWAAALTNATTPPLVHSISYGGDESQEDQSSATRFDQEMQKAALRGLTVMVASGDDGVAGADARGNPGKCGFSPSFPASSPNVVSVGATQGPEKNTAEVACTSDTGGQITSGGGFSVYFAQPSYQSTAVAAYLKSGVKIPPTNLFNVNGRAYPDVAMLGHSYEIYVDGQILVGSGTSASSPVFAGFVALVNDARLNAGKAPLGFLNPALYQLPASVFHDITSGENNCAAAAPTPTCCTHGFYCAKGFDPVTGLGSVDFTQFKAALLSL